MEDICFSIFYQKKINNFKANTEREEEQPAHRVDVQHMVVNDSSQQILHQCLPGLTTYLQVDKGEAWKHRPSGSFCSCYQR